MQEGKTIQSVAKSMKLLDILAASNGPLGLAEISAQTGWPKSTVHGLLSTMRDFSVVAQDEEGRYMLGIRLFEYGCNIGANWKIIGVTRPHMQYVSYTTGETVFLSILDQRDVITLDYAENRIGIKVAADVGHRLPIHCTAQGKLFLAYMSEEKRREVLRNVEWTAYTDRTITSPEQLEKELEIIRIQGYAEERSEYKTGLRAMASPIFDQDGNVRYALGILGMFRQIETEQFERSAEVVRETAAKITLEMTR